MSCTQPAGGTRACKTGFISMDMEGGELVFACIVLLAYAATAAESSSLNYPWLTGNTDTIALADLVPPPKGYERLPLETDSFAGWLRMLPMKPGCPPVRLFNGRLKGIQDAHAAVVHIDTGARDLQQCADAIMRLRAEYLFSRKQYPEIHFNFTNGDEAAYRRWAEGFRPAIHGNTVTWRRTAEHDASYSSFREYLDTVFMYAGTNSFCRELTNVPLVEMRPGDVFLQPASVGNTPKPGHAVLVVDMAHKVKTGERCFLLLQSFMPAQDIHILKNPKNATLSPWYLQNCGEKLVTPEWTFGPGDLYRFPEKVN